MAPPRTVARVASTKRYALGEGILADQRTGEVHWVDIHAGRVFTGELDGTESIRERSRTCVDRTVGAVAPAADGGVLVAAARGLAVISPTGRVSLGPDLLGSREKARLNDGSVDPQGRYLVGSLALDAPTDREVLLRVSSDGSVETLRTGVTLSNGLGWSPDGGTLYHVDTMVKRMSAHPYSADGEWDPDGWVDIPCDFAGHPDGLEVDASGALWVAQWGGSVVQRFDPTGALMQTIELPTPSVTCPGLVADGLLAITTSTDETQRDRAAGRLFLCDVDASPQPTNYWSGSTLTPYWSN